VIYRALASLVLVVILSGSSQHEEVKPYALEEVPLTQISADLSNGKTTSVAVTKDFAATRVIASFRNLEQLIPKSLFDRGVGDVGSNELYQRPGVLK
jgi:hypothetical protein